MVNKDKVLGIAYNKYSLNASYYEISGVEPAKIRPSSQSVGTWTRPPGPSAGKKMPTPL